MGGYCKLSSNLINSSIWDQPDSVRIVWITMLAMADASGFVQSSLPGLAHQCRKSRDETVAALEVLKSPDPDSQNPDNEGRRIAQIEGGWLIFNYALHRAQHQTLSDDHESVSTRERVRRFRLRKRAEKDRLESVTVTLPNVTGVTSASASASALNREGNSKGKRKPKDLPEVVAYAKTKGISASDAEAFFDSQESGGWTRSGKALRDWQAALRTWKANAWLPSQKNGKHQKPTSVDYQRRYMPPAREPTDVELETARRIASESKAKLIEELAR